MLFISTINTNATLVVNKKREPIFAGVAHLLKKIFEFTRSKKNQAPYKIYSNISVAWSWFHQRVKCPGVKRPDIIIRMFSRSNRKCREFIN